MKVQYLGASLAVAPVILMGALSSARAANEWFMLGEKAIKSADPSVEIKSEAGRWKKDVTLMAHAEAASDRDGASA